MFFIDERLLSGSFFLKDWPLSSIFLKNEQAYPWLMLVPRKENIQEFYQLENEERNILTEEIHQLSLIIKDYFKPDKLNVGALGNVVSQLHVHVVGRYKNDPLWPQGIWQNAMLHTPYEDEQLKELLPTLKDQISKYFPA